MESKTKRMDLMKAPKRDKAPENPVPGTVYTDLNTNKTHFYDGYEWVVIGEERTPLLFQQVVQWGSEKGLVDGPKAEPGKQLIKTMEELGEVSSALLRGNPDALQDGIGDVMVCLIILAAQNGTDAFKCLQGAYDEIKHRRGKTIDGVFVKEQDL